MVRGRGRHGGRGPPRMQSRGQGSSWSKLDTRSTTVVRVVEIPSGTGLGDLRAHFSQFGVITGLEEDPPLGARVTFEARKQAEAAIVGGKRLGEHTMILQWGTSSPAVASAGLTPSGHTKAPALSRCTSGSGGIATSQSGRGAGEKLEAVAKEEKGSEPKVKTGSGMEADASEDQPEAKQEAAGQERATVEVRGEVAEVEEVSVADELPFESDSANPVEEDEGEEPPDVVDVADEGDEEDEHPDTVNMEDEEELEFDEAGEGHK